MSKTRPPIIGITIDYATGGNSGNYSKLPHYAIRENHIATVAKYGAILLPLCYDTQAADYLLENILDGLIVIGGASDIDPSYYGEEIKSDKIVLNVKKTNFEHYVLTKALAKKTMPILGICGGMQLLAIVYGGSMMQHIADESAEYINHEQPNPKNEPGHVVSVKAQSLLDKITGGIGAFSVNSAHHQAVKLLGAGLEVVAIAPDGIIEAIEDPMHRFCLGVQWHPEYEITKADSDIFAAFVAACTENHAQ